MIKTRKCRKGERRLGWNKNKEFKSAPCTTAMGYQKEMSEEATSLDSPVLNSLIRTFHHEIVFVSVAVKQYGKSGI